MAVSREESIGMEEMQAVFSTDTTSQSLHKHLNTVGVKV